MHEFLVTTARGLDNLLQDELSLLCPDTQFSLTGGQVRFSGSVATAYRICLWSRLANRVLLKLADGSIKQADDVYQLAGSVNWSALFDLDTTFVVDFIGTNRQINNSQFGALKIKDAIVDQFSEVFGSRPSVDRAQPQIRFQGRLQRDKLALYLDLSGHSLHQRHYREETGEAPLKEHLACAMLMRSGWTQHQQHQLLDPMCGSGTIVIEAAQIAANMAAGLGRDDWGFDHWKQHDATLWQSMIEDARQQVCTPQVIINACDLDRKVLIRAKANANRAEVFDFIQFHHADATRFSIKQQQQPGYIVSNPPYGERLSELTQLLPLFQAWGSHLKQHFKGWHLSLLTSNRDLLRQLKLVANKEYKLMNAKLECQLVNFELDEKNCEVREGQQNASDFGNRVAKNLKRLSKWLKTQNTNCYRLYDADLPEYNVAVDRYADWLVVQEYAPPKDVPEQKARKRLHECLLELPGITGVNPSNIVLKTREQQKGSSQYQKMAERKTRIEVEENGARFWVNLTDYLDTGLFLDHRITRQKVQQLAKNKDVLNLFAYTGSVSVYAALGGARSVTTVDMSRTYLDWAKDNFKLNGLSGAYEFIQGDCLQWLSEHHGQYELIFVDPPSFSNSKRMRNTWDVQRDHVAMLTDVKRCLKPGGTIIFSNNLRQFKLDDNAISAMGLAIENISAQTLPEDFKRNPKIHHCWILTDTQGQSS